MSIPGLPRRTVLLGAAAGPLVVCAAACGGGTDKPPVAAPSTGEVLAKTTDIPVGSGKIIGTTVVTQPTAGVFQAFVARCTHAGCRLSDVVGKTIDCPCHGSTFALDGAVTRGPAAKPLTPVAVTVRGTDIIAG